MDSLEVWFSKKYLLLQSLFDIQTRRKGNPALYWPFRLFYIYFLNKRVIDRKFNCNKIYFKNNCCELEAR